MIYSKEFVIASYEISHLKKFIDLVFKIFSSGVHVVVCLDSRKTTPIERTKVERAHAKLKGTLYSKLMTEALKAQRKTNKRLNFGLKVLVSTALESNFKGIHPEVEVGGVRCPLTSYDLAYLVTDNFSHTHVVIKGNKKEARRLQGTEYLLLQEKLTVHNV